MIHIFLKKIHDALESREAQSKGQQLLSGQIGWQNKSEQVSEGATLMVFASKCAQRINLQLPRSFLRNLSAF